MFDSNKSESLINVDDKNSKISYIARSGDIIRLW